jgi:hypothetical protein
MRTIQLLIIAAGVACAQSSAPSLTVLHSFTGQNGDGEYPYTVVIGPHGALYGTTASGGISVGILTGGTVFELNPPSPAGGQWTETIIHSFKGGSDGLEPNAGLVMGPNGSLYGTTYGGGGGTSSGCQIYTGCGTVFELTPPSAPGRAWTESVIHSFQGGADGGGPGAPVMFGPNGIIYGTTSGGLGPCTSSGGIPGCGTVFSLQPPAQAGGAWTETPLYHFTGRNGDGMWPFAGVVLGKNGALFGVTSEGGTAGTGTAFELKPPAAPGGSWTETILYTFTDQNGDGGFPNQLLAGANGVFYGTTAWGGSTGAGMVFEIQPPASPGGIWKEINIHNFDNATDGFLPQAAILTKNQTLIGGTDGGGPNGSGGVLYALHPPSVFGGSWTETVLYAFTGQVGSAYAPTAALTLSSSGVLYGPAGGGTSNFGTIFALTPPQ